MRPIIAALASLALLSACDGEPANDTSTASAEPGDLNTDRDEESDEPILAEDLILDEYSPTMEFEWSVPALIGRYPKLLETLRQRAEATRSDLAETAREQAQFRAEEELPPQAVMHDERWRVAFRNPALINLKVEAHNYTGGAHPNSFFQSKFWDTEEQREVEFSDLFINWPVARDTLSKRYCAALDEMRSERRDGRTASADFEDCPDLDEQPIALIGPRGGEPNGMTVLLSPYVAGPYAEGPYEVSISFDRDLQETLKARYRGEG